jgi:hypothetical protein
MDSPPSKNTNLNEKTESHQKMIQRNLWKILSKSSLKISHKIASEQHKQENFNQPMKTKQTPLPPSDWPNIPSSSSHHHQQRKNTFVFTFPSKNMKNSYLGRKFYTTFYFIFNYFRCLLK